MDSTKTYVWRKPVDFRRPRWSEVIKYKKLNKFQINLEFNWCPTNCSELTTEPMEKTQDVLIL